MNLVIIAFIVKLMSFQHNHKSLLNNTFGERLSW